MFLFYNDKNYSQSITLYDSAPKFYWPGRRNCKTKPNETLPHILREFTFEKEKYNIEIVPAQIQSGDGNIYQYYPGPREEIIEEAIIKIAVNGNGRFVKDRATVFFSLYELRNELKNTGHTYSIREINEALTICKRTTLIVKRISDDKIKFETSIFDLIGTRSKKDWNKNGKQSESFVILNLFVSQAITDGEYRQFDYNKHMQLRNPLSRWLHKRLIHYFKFASNNKIYNIRASTIIKESPMPEYKRFRDSINYINKAWKHLEDADIVSPTTKKTDKDGRKIVDVIYIVKGTWIFNRSQVKANEHSMRINQKLSKYEITTKRDNRQMPLNLI